MNYTNNDGSVLFIFRIYYYCILDIYIHILNDFTLPSLNKDYYYYLLSVSKLIGATYYGVPGSGLLKGVRGFVFFDTKKGAKTF